MNRQTVHKIILFGLANFDHFHVRSILQFIS